MHSDQSSNLIHLPLEIAKESPRQVHTSPESAVEDLCERYAAATNFLREHFTEFRTGEKQESRFRAFYPELHIETASFTRIDSRLSYGHVSKPGTYTTSITRPDLYQDYLRHQIDQLMP